MATDPGIRNPMQQRDLERLRYWQGQKLLSKDFNDLAQIEDQLRWWHNRSLHEVPGVLKGLTVHMDGTDVVISPGLAYDGYGRELIHARESRLPIPDTIPSQGMILWAYLRSNEHRQTSASGVCLSPMLDPFDRKLEFTWLQLGETGGSQAGVQLGRLFRSSGGLVFDPIRSFTRPLARPRIASGSTSPSSTSWELWELEGNKDALLGLQVRVDTSAFGFTRTPCYFAWIQAVNWLAPGRRINDPFDDLSVEHIDETSMHGFTFRLSSHLGARLWDGRIMDLFHFLRDVKPYVCWIGIEHAGDQVRV